MYQAKVERDLLRQKKAVEARISGTHTHSLFASCITLRLSRRRPASSWPRCGPYWRRIHHLVVSHTQSFTHWMTQEQALKKAKKVCEDFQAGNVMMSR